MKTAMFLTAGLFVSFFLLACSVEASNGPLVRPVKDYKVYRVGYTPLHEFRLDDGTRCVVIGSSQGSVDCDFK